MYTVSTVYGTYSVQCTVHKWDRIVRTVVQYVLWCHTEENLGISPDQILTQFEGERKIQEKNDAINKKPDPVIELQDALMKEDLLKEYKEDLNVKEFSNQKPLWIGEKKDSKYSFTEPTCSKKFELSGIIKAYLGISTFVSFKKTLNAYDQKVFTEIYNYFKNIYSGDAYTVQISTDGNDLYQFIMSPKQQNESFRSYIIELCNFN